MKKCIERAEFVSGIIENYLQETVLRIEGIGSSEANGGDMSKLTRRAEELREGQKAMNKVIVHLKSVNRSDFMSLNRDADN